MIIEAINRLYPGCKFHTFADGAQCANFLSTNPSIPIPAVFLFDHNMPRKTGVELFEEIFKAHSYSQVTKMLWSTSFTTLIAEKCKLLGLNGFFEKPATADGFHQLAIRILEAAGVTVGPTIK